MEKTTRCSVREGLQKRATETLQKVIELTQGQIECLAKNDQSTLTVLDKKLEQMFGEKERAFGALRQHSKEHGC
jgi:hypothetical protein